METGVNVTSSQTTHGLSLLDIIKEIQLSFRDFKELRKLPQHRQKALANGLALVAISIRTGYLVDGVSPSNAIELFSGLLARLRPNRIIGPQCEDVVHVYEPASDQSFFVNVSLFRARFPLGDQQPSKYPTFMHLRPGFPSTDTIPEAVYKTLETIRSQLNAPASRVSLSLQNGIEMETAVPLAAILIDYPVAYVPDTAHPRALSGEPLDFYECLLSDSSADLELTIMKFSCPASATEENTALSPSRINGQLVRIV